jgi:hypothetical protein
MAGKGTKMDPAFRTNEATHIFNDANNWELNFFAEIYLFANIQKGDFLGTHDYNHSAVRFKRINLWGCDDYGSIRIRFFQILRY